MNGVDVSIILGVLVPLIITLYYKLGKVEGKLVQLEKYVMMVIDCAKKEEDR